MLAPEFAIGKTLGAGKKEFRNDGPMLGPWGQTIGKLAADDPKGAGPFHRRFRLDLLGEMLEFLGATSHEIDIFKELRFIGLRTELTREFAELQGFGNSRVVHVRQSGFRYQQSEHEIRPRERTVGETPIRQTT